MYRNFQDFLSSLSPQEKERFINVSRESSLTSQVLQKLDQLKTRIEYADEKINKLVFE